MLRVYLSKSTMLIVFSHSLSSDSVCCGKNRRMRLMGISGLDHRKFFHQCPMPVREPDIGYICLRALNQQRNIIK